MIDHRSTFLHHKNAGGHTKREGDDDHHWVQNAEDTEALLESVEVAHLAVCF